MATDLRQASPPDRLDVRLSSPLDQMRGTIRRYVVVEGLLAAGLFVVLWFALGLVLDFGLFKATGFDWVVDVPRWVRGTALAGMLLLLAALVARRVAFRLTRELSYPSLALVLERRFPAVLGDRLITAVELADVGGAERYGYSGEMIRATIEEARERVARAPVSEVFNWGRLWRMAAVLVGAGAAVGVAAFAAFALGTGGTSPKAFGWRAAHVSGIWAERNLLVMNTPWPRRAHLELVGFAEEELKVGKDAALANPPQVRVRAVKWVVADPAETFGWRPMMWSDVTADMAGGPVPPASPSASAKADSLTVDRVEREGKGDPAVAKALDALNALADDPAMARRVRRLDVPEAVVLQYDGLKTSGGGSMSPEAGGEFVGSLTDLKESVSFRASAEDFMTPRRAVTLVPPPALSLLVRSEYQPAYLFHPPPSDGDADWLRGKTQRMPDTTASLTGDRSVFSVPFGTEVLFTATTTKPLREAAIRPKAGRVPGAKPGSADPVPLPLTPSGDGFTAEFRGAFRVTENVEFDLEFTDTDGVTASRPVLIQKADDAPPTVEIATEVLRKQGNLFLVTPAARVPFVPESAVRDEAGLSRVEYVFEYSQVEASAVVGLQARVAAGVWAPAPVFAGLPSGLMPAFNATLVRLVTKGDSKQKGAALVGRFDGQYRDLRRETKQVLDGLLVRPLAARTPLVTGVRLENSQVDYFDIRKALPALAVPATEIQPRYRIDLNVLATDTNVENAGGPKTGTNPEPVRLLVVSEADLLAEISKEEEALTLTLDKALAALRNARANLSEMAGTIAGVPANEIDNLKSRGIGMTQDVARARDFTNAVHVDYRRILRECEANQFQKGTIDHYARDIVAPLADVLDRSFANAEKAQSDMQAPFAQGRKPDVQLVFEAGQKVELLIADLQAVRDRLGEALSLDKLRNQLRSILDTQTLVSAELAELKRRLEKEIFEPSVRPVGPLVLAKGEKKAVKHVMDWKLYDKDDLVVRFAASADALTVPAEVKLSSDKNELEYEVTAGQKAGEYTLTVTPAVGKPVVVRVTVR